MGMDHRLPREVFFSRSSVSSGGMEETHGRDRIQENGLDAVAPFLYSNEGNIVCYC